LSPSVRRNSIWRGCPCLLLRQRQVRTDLSRLRPEKLNTRFILGTEPEEPIVPRCYTLTHSDSTGDLYLTVGPEYDRGQISGWYTRFMRDEVLGQWQGSQDGSALAVHCHVSGGLVLGSAAWRDAIFRRELPLVLECFRFGDRALFEAHPELDQSHILVHFHSTRSRYDRVESWGTFQQYR
jgi:hypothetical protein